MNHRLGNIRNMCTCTSVKNTKVCWVGKPPVTVAIHKQFSGNLVYVLAITNADKSVMHFTAGDMVGPGGKKQHKHQQPANNSFLHAFGKKVVRIIAVKGT